MCWWSAWRCQGRKNHGDHRVLLPGRHRLVRAEFIQAEQAAYFETAVEDDEICYRMHRGRKALWLRGESEVGPYQSPTEDGMQHFHEFYRRKMGEALRG